MTRVLGPSSGRTASAAFSVSHSLTANSTISTGPMLLGSSVTFGFGRWTSPCTPSIFRTCLRMAAAGNDVFLIARGAHLKAMRKHGLKIESVHGDVHLPKPNVTDDPKSIGPVDIVLFAVKLWDTEKAAEAVRPLLGPNTRVITLQNGVDSYERIAPIVGSERAIACVTYFVTVIDRPGVIKQASQFQSIICGTIDGRADASLAAFVAAAKAANINITQSDNNGPGGMKASMANDLDRGNRLELDWLAGQVSRLGKELKVPTPVNDTIYAALKLYRMGS